MTSSGAALKAIINDAVSWGPSKIERIIKGVGNEVYLLKAPNNHESDLILRIHHGNHPEFYTEKWAFDKVKKQGVAVPTILKIADFIDGDNKLTYSVETALRGRSLDDYLEKGLNNKQKERFAVLAGEAMAHIHQVKTVGFGHFTKNGVGRFKTLAESMQQHDDYDDLVGAALTTRLSGAELERAVAMIDTINSAEESHLIHTDYAPKHIFIDKGKISGVIDFEICMSGLAATDFNRWRTQESRISIKGLILGYERVRPLPSDFWDIMYIIQIHSALRTMLYHFRTTQNKTELNKAANEVKLLVRNQKPLLA
jgi:aminoglycoside phosphotransferase (APT) family kinase protein